MNHENATQSRAPNTYMLPRDLRPNRQVFESVGFSFEDIEDIKDKVLCQVTLPEGWKLETDGKYWTHLIDENGNQRGSSFHQNDHSFERGYMHLKQKFYIASEYHNPEDFDKRFVQVSVKSSGGKIVFVAGTCQDFCNIEYEKLMDIATEFLQANFPEWRDPSKYWD